MAGTEGSAWHIEKFQLSIGSCCYYYMHWEKLEGYNCTLPARTRGTKIFKRYFRSKVNKAST